MEEEIKSLRTLLSHVLNTSTRSPLTFNPAHNSSTNRDYNNTSRQSNRSVTETNRQKRTSLNINYGGIDETNDFPVEMLMTLGAQPQYNDSRKSDQNQFVQHNGRQYGMHSGENQNGSCINSNNRTIDSNSSQHLYVQQQQQHRESNEQQQNDDHIVQMEKETLELRRELQETLANQKRAEKKAQTLVHNYSYFV